MSLGSTYEHENDRSPHRSRRRPRFLKVFEDDDEYQRMTTRTIFMGGSHAGLAGATEHENGTAKDENDSPPLEGCRGGLFQMGRPTPEG